MRPIKVRPLLSVDGNTAAKVGVSPRFVILNEEGFAIAEVVETLSGASFNRPEHETIYDAMVDLNGRGALADAVTVADELSNRGQLLKLGGTPETATGA